MGLFLLGKRLLHHAVTHKKAGRTGVIFSMLDGTEAAGVVRSLRCEVHRDGQVILSPAAVRSN